MTKILIICLLIVFVTLGSIAWLCRDRLVAWFVRRRTLVVEQSKADAAMQECLCLYRLTLERAGYCNSKEARALIESADLYLNYAQGLRPSLEAFSCTARGFIGIAASELKKAARILNAS